MRCAELIADDTASLLHGRGNQAGLSALGMTIGRGAIFSGPSEGGLAAIHEPFFPFYCAGWISLANASIQGGLDFGGAVINADFFAQGLSVLGQANFGVYQHSSRSQIHWFSCSGQIYFSHATFGQNISFLGASLGRDCVGRASLIAQAATIKGSLILAHTSTEREERITSVAHEEMDFRWIDVRNDIILKTYVLRKRPEVANSVTAFNLFFKREGYSDEQRTRQLTATYAEQILVDLELGKVGGVLDVAVVTQFTKDNYEPQLGDLLPKKPIADLRSLTVSELRDDDGDGWGDLRLLLEGFACRKAPDRKCKRNLWMMHQQLAAARSKVSQPYGFGKWHFASVVLNGYLLASLVRLYYTWKARSAHRRLQPT